MSDSRQRWVRIILGLSVACPLCVHAGLDLTASSTPLAPPKNHPSVLVHHARDDRGGNTRLRFAVQWFEVVGQPKLNDHGTPGFSGRFDRGKSPELDDYLDGTPGFPDVCTFRDLHFAVTVKPLAGAAQAPSYERREIEGWSVHIRRELLAEEGRLIERVLELLRKQLQEIVRMVPAAALRELRQVPLYVSPEYPGVMPRAEFHPDIGWLRANGRDPAMAKAVEFSNVRRFEAEMDRMPNFTLHELAHAYHNRVLPEGFANLDLKTAFERAKGRGKYDRVERWHGNGKSNTIERAYAMNDGMEYFAESSEAFFSRNDFFPFTRDELKAHDPEMFALLAKLWGTR